MERLNDGVSRCWQVFHSLFSSVLTAAAPHPLNTHTHIYRHTKGKCMSTVQKLELYWSDPQVWNNGECAYTHTHIGKNSHTHARTQVQKHARTHKDRPTDTQKQKSACMYKNTHTNTHEYRYTHKENLIYTHTRTHKHQYCTHERTRCMQICTQKKKLLCT